MCESFKFNSTLSNFIFFIYVSLFSDDQTKMDYLTMKWKMWYKFLDVNNDGKMSTADTEESRNKFTGLHHLVDDKADSLGSYMDKWWNTYVLPASGGEVSKDEFLSRLSASYNKDKTAFKMKMEKCFQVMSNIIDTKIAPSTSKNFKLLSMHSDSINPR